MTDFEAWYQQVERLAEGSVVGDRICGRFTSAACRQPMRSVNI